MTTITPPNVMVNGQSLGVQQYIESRALNALLQALEGTSQEGQVNLTVLRQDAAFEAGVPVANIVP